MTVKVVKDFADKITPWITHKVGDVLSVPDDRAKDLIERGLATSTEPAKKESEKTVPKKRQQEGKTKNVSKSKRSASIKD